MFYKCAYLTPAINPLPYPPAQWVCKICKDTKSSDKWANSTFLDIHNQVSTRTRTH